MPENRADVFHLGGPLDQGALCWLRPIERRSLDTSTHRRATSTRTRAPLYDSETTAISQQQCRTSADGLRRKGPLEGKAGLTPSLRPYHLWHVTWATSDLPLGADMGELVLDMSGQHRQRTLPR